MGPVGYEVGDWTSADDFTLHLSFVLRFRTAETGPWNEGRNLRFVHLTRPGPGGGLVLSWATSP